MPPLYETVILIWLTGGRVVLVELAGAETIIAPVLGFRLSLMHSGTVIVETRDHIIRPRGDRRQEALRIQIGVGVGSVLAAVAGASAVGHGS